MPVDHLFILLFFSCSEQFITQHPFFFLLCSLMIQPSFLTSLDARNSGAFSDIREPISLHQAVIQIQYCGVVAKVISQSLHTAVFTIFVVIISFVGRQYYFKNNTKRKRSGHVCKRRTPYVFQSDFSNNDRKFKCKLLKMERNVFRVLRGVAMVKEGMLRSARWRTSTLALICMLALIETRCVGNHK